MLNDELKKKIEDAFDSKIKATEALTKQVTLLSFNDSKMIIKKVNTKTKNIYDFLASQKVENVLYPLKKIIYDKECYFVYKYINSYEYPNEKKIKDMIESVDEVHKKTGFTVRLTDSNFKFFMRIYKNLDRIFQTLEMFIRECEGKTKKTDFDWIVLSKYHIYLTTKKMMYSLQRKIHKYIDNNGNCIYSLNHGNLNLNHYVQRKLLSFDNAYVGIFISDFAKLYVSVDDIDGEWFSDLEAKINSYGNDFYKIYFKFLVLYIYIINLRFSSFDEHTVLKTYNQLSMKISRFLTLTSSY